MQKWKASFVFPKRFIYGPQINQIFLEIDQFFPPAASATAFYEEKPVLDFLQDVLRCRRLPSKLKDFERKTFAKEIKGKRNAETLHT